MTSFICCILGSLLMKRIKYKTDRNWLATDYRLISNTSDDGFNLSPQILSAVLEWKVQQELWHAVPPTGGGQQGQFALGPQCKGVPKQCQTCSNKIRLSVTFQSSFFNGLVLLYFWLNSTCIFALLFMLLTQIILRGYCAVRKPH